MNDGNSSDVGGLVRVGTGSKAASLGLQQVQQIFHEITGKTDTLSKRYQVNFKIDADDLVQLHERLRQAVEQYNVKAHNCSVTVHFIDDNRQQFQSFESFRLMSASSTACVESVHIKYDLLIIPTLTQALQTFELQIQLTSRVAAERRIRNMDGPPLPRILHVLLTGTTGVISVKHVDHTVARTLLDTADRWLTSCKHEKPGSFVQLLKRHSHWAPLICQYGISFIGAVALVHELPKYVTPASYADQLAMFLLMAVFISYAFVRSGWHLGNWIEDSLDAYHPLSYIKLTRGDESEIQAAEKRTHHGIVSGTVAFFAALIEAVSAKFIVIGLLALVARV